MTKKWFLIVVVLALPICCRCGGLPQSAAEGESKMVVSVRGENCFISSGINDSTSLLFWFKKCMANELYTFYEVALTKVITAVPSEELINNSLLVNQAFSDNIGPFLVEGVGWCGGNHTDENGGRTATTDSFSISVDGHALAGDTVAFDVGKVNIDVTNVILDTFAIERISYRIEGGSVSVSAEHHFYNAQPLNVLRYYGMQSMFLGETEEITPGGLYSSWTAIDKVGQFLKRDYPDFRMFSERNGTAFQSCLLENFGLGDHAFVAPDQPVFIGNSNGKSYHCLMARHIVRKGDVTMWKGVYGWGVRER